MDDGKPFGRKILGAIVCAGLLALIASTPPLDAQEDPIQLPPAAAEALRQNGSILDGSLLESLAAPPETEQNSDSRSSDFVLAEQLLRTARLLEKREMSLPEAQGLPRRLRVVALQLLRDSLEPATTAHALDPLTPSPFQPKPRGDGDPLDPPTLNSDQ